MGGSFALHCQYVRTLHFTSFRNYMITLPVFIPAIPSAILIRRPVIHNRSTNELGPEEDIGSRSCRKTKPNGPPAIEIQTRYLVWVWFKRRPSLQGHGISLHGRIRSHRPCMTAGP